MTIVQKVSIILKGQMSRLICWVMIPIYPPWYKCPEGQPEVGFSISHYLDEFGSSDEVDGIFTMLVNACANGEDIGIEDDVVGFKSHFGQQQLIGSCADLHFTVSICRLGDGTQARVSGWGWVYSVQ